MGLKVRERLIRSTVFSFYEFWYLSGPSCYSYLLLPLSWSIVTSSLQSPFSLFLLPRFHFVCFIPSFHSHHLCLVIVSHTTALHQKENGKTANPAASYGIRVYQPIMPFSDLFSSRDRSLCACIPPPPPPYTFPLSPNNGTGCCIFSCKTLCNVAPPPPSPWLL